MITVYLPLHDIMPKFAHAMPTSKSTDAMSTAANRKSDTKKLLKNREQSSATESMVTEKTDSDQANSQRLNIAELLESEYRGVSLYAMTMLVLVLAILWTGINVVEQIQNYHQQYNELARLKKEFRQSQIEHQRMLIEQQTFSATPQVSSRAVNELHMFYPTLSHRLIIHTNDTMLSKPSAMPPATLASSTYSSQAVNANGVAASQPSH